jgi:hypothetical protein
MTGGWKYVGASVIGTSHLKSSAGICQDSHRCVYIDGLEALVCVVSDGAGSAARAEEGSDLACDVVVQRARAATQVEAYSRDFALSILAQIRETLAESAETAGRLLRDYACTLLVSIAGREKTAFWQLGDGAICFRVRSKEEMHYAFWPAKGEYANVTEFVTDANAAEELRFDGGDLQLVDLALFSDGLERLALDFKTGEVHSPFFSSLFPYLYHNTEGHLVELEEQMRAFLSSERLNARTDDDKTLILATRESDAA